MSHYGDNNAPGRIAVVGCGGLGVPAVWTLALAGARQLRLFDADVVEVSNLHRQVLYGSSDVGQPKASVLAALLHKRFGVDCEVVPERLTAERAEALLAGCAAALDATDDAASKFAVNDWAVAGRGRGEPRWSCVAAAIGRRGQWFVTLPHGPDYRSIFEAPPPDDELATCAIAGVLGPVTGIAGGLAARALWLALQQRPDPAHSALQRLEPRGLLRTLPPDCTPGT